MPRRLATIALLTLALAAPARAGTYYYAMVFGSDTCPKQLRYAHTWATFIKTTGEGSDPNGYAIEMRTISWMPQKPGVRILNPVPEPGMNVDLYRTLAIEYGHGDTVTMWGPFVVRPEIYERAGEVVSVLESGQARYRAISGMELLTGDCIHAVAAVDPVFGRGALPADPDRQARVAVHRPPGRDPGLLRPGRLRQLVADPPPRPRPLPDRGRPAAGDPEAGVRPLRSARMTRGLDRGA